MATNANSSEPTLTIIFGCLATVLALAGIVVGYVQYRSYNRTSTPDSSPSSLEAGLQLSAITPGDQPQEQGETGSSLSPIVPDGQSQEQPESDPAPKSDDVEVSSTPSDSDTARTLDSRSPVEIARGSA
jgi:hypothetical protein